MTDYIYTLDQELPAITLAWNDGTGTIIDFTTGWTFTVRFAEIAARTTIVGTTKTTGITGTATSPNLTIDWTATDFAGLLADHDYLLWIYARRTSDSKDRVFRQVSPPTIHFLAAPA